MLVEKCLHGGFNGCDGHVLDAPTRGLASVMAAMIVGSADACVVAGWLKNGMNNPPKMALFMT